MLFEGNISKESIKDIIKILRTHAYYEEVTIRDISIEQFDNIYLSILNSENFNIRKCAKNEYDAYYFSVWGTRLVALLVQSCIPFGSLLKLGSRQAIEAKVMAHGNDISIKLAMYPWDEFWNEPEELFLGQGVLERLIENSRAKTELEDILEVLKTKTPQLENGIDPKYKEEEEEDTLTYLPLINKYELRTDVRCPHCQYQFIARTILQNRYDSSGRAYCPSCKQKLTLIIGG